MNTSHKHAAFVVFRGKTPGVYYSPEECQQQTEGIPKSKFQGFSRAYDAESAWSEWQRKLYVKLGASTFLQQTAPRARPRLESAYVPPKAYSRPANEPIAHGPAVKHEREVGRDARRGLKKEPLVELPPQWSSSQNNSHQQGHYPKPKLEYSPPPKCMPSVVAQENIFPKYEESSSLAKYDPSLFERTSSYNTPPPSSSPPIPPVKRPVICIEISDDEEEKPFKRPKMEEEYKEPVLTVEERFELRQLDRQRIPAREQVEEARIELTPEQDKVVNLALRKNNIFMTGAAGSGKTVTLKEILLRIRKRKKGGNVQVIAPTGIAALPLDGKTTYSFAGVSYPPCGDFVEIEF